MTSPSDKTEHLPFWDPHNERWCCEELAVAEDEVKASNEWNNHWRERGERAEKVIEAARATLAAIHAKHVNGGIWTSVANTAAPLHEALAAYDSLSPKEDTR